MCTLFSSSRRPGAWPAAILTALLFAALARMARADPGDVITEVTIRQNAGKKQSASTDRLKAALHRRLSILSESPGKITIDDQGLIHAHLVEPSVSDAQLQWFTRPGALEVAWLPNVQTPQNPNGRYTVTAYGLQNSLTFRFMDRRADRFVPTETVLNRAPRLTSGEELEKDGVSPAAGAGPGVIRLKFGPAGTRRLARFARGHTGALLAVLVDGKLIAVPVPIAPRGEALSEKGDVTPQPTPVEQGELEVTTAFSTPAEAGYLITVVNTPLPGLTVVGKRTFVE